LVSTGQFSGEVNQEPYLSQPHPIWFRYHLGPKSSGLIRVNFSIG